MKRLRLVFLSIILMALQPIASFALDITFKSDYERKGFLIGLGAGGGGVITNAVDFSITNGGGFTTDFKIGYGTSDRLALIGTFKAAWYANSDGLSILSGIPAFGVIRWFEPENRSAFLTGGVGIPVLVPYGRYFYYGFYGSESNNYEPYMGLGFFAGAGLELDRCFSIEADLHTGELHWLGAGHVPTLSVVTFYLTFNFLLY